MLRVLPKTGKSGNTMTRKDKVDRILQIIEHEKSVLERSRRIEQTICSPLIKKIRCKEARLGLVETYENYVMIQISGTKTGKRNRLQTVVVL